RHGVNLSRQLKSLPSPVCHLWRVRFPLLDKNMSSRQGSGGMTGQSTALRNGQTLAEADKGRSNGGTGAAKAERAVASAVRTVNIEAEGLAALAEALKGPMADAFTEAVHVISGLRGRVIVTGIG